MTRRTRQKVRRREGADESRADFSLTASLRGSWLTWLDEHYQSDLLVSGGKATVTLLTGPPFADEIVTEVAKLPGVREVQGMRIAEIQYAGRPAVLQALDRATSGLPLLDGVWSDVADAFWEGAGVALGDNLAYKTGVHKGDTIPLLTPMGERRMLVLGVFSDFQGGGDLGSIAVSRSLYRSLWDDSVVNRMRVWTVAGADIQALRASIEGRWSRTHGLRAVTAAEFRAAMAELIENIFLVSYALVLVAVTISFVGVVNFLLAALLDRRAELRTLDAIGVSRGQLRGAIVLEGALVGMIGAAMGVVAAVVVSRVIVLHSVPMVNGWHFTYVFPTLSAAALALAAVVMAAAAGLLPARVALGGRALAEGSVE